MQTRSLISMVLRLLCIFSGGVISRADFAPVETNAVPVGPPLPVHQKDIALVGGTVNIAISPASDTSALLARVNAEYRLRNLSSQRRSVTLAFPVVNAPLPKSKFIPDHGGRIVREQGSNAWFVVRQDGKPIDVLREDVPAHTPISGIDDAGTGQVDAKAYTAILNDWLAQHPEVNATLESARKAYAEASTNQGASGQFMEKARAELIDPQLADDLLSCLVSASNLSAIVALMPEVDPALRYDTGADLVKYVSFLDHYKVEQYRPYESEWRDKILKWVAARSALADLVDGVRDERIRQQRQYARAEELVNMLHVEFGLTNQVASSLAWHLIRATVGSPPPMDALAALCPSAKQRMKDAQAERDKLYAAWGMDLKYLSTFTGMPSWPRPDWDTRKSEGFLYTEGFCYGEGFAEDRSALLPDGEPDLGLKAGMLAMAYSFRLPLFRTAPSLLQCSIEIPARGETTLAVAFDMPSLDCERRLDVIDPRILGSQFAYILKTGRYWEEAGAISISISVPDGYYPVIIPEPARSMKSEGRTVYDLTVKGSDSNLQFALISAPNTFLELIEPTDEHIAQLREALAHVRCQAVVPILRAVIVNTLFRAGRLHEAWIEHVTFARDYGASRIPVSDFTQDGQLKKARETFDWMEHLVLSPFLNEDRIDQHTFNQLSKYDKQALARNVLAHMSSYTNTSDKLYAALFLCEAGVEPEKQLQDMIKLAGLNQNAAKTALLVMRYLSIDKTPATDFIIQHVNPAPRTIPGGYTNVEWGIHVYAAQSLRNLTHTNCAPQLMELYRKSNDAYVKDACIMALAGMKPALPFRQWEELGRPICASGPISAPGSVVNSYFDVLLANYPTQAVPLLQRLKQEFPQYLPWIAHRLVKLGDRDAGEEIIAIYNTSSNKTAVQAAVSSLHEWDDPTIFNRIRYRSDGEIWMEEYLVDIIARHGGGDKAFAFVENYYLKRVQSRDKEVRHPWRCALAFGKLGDKRALPYLREMLKTDNGRDDVAHAIGDILLDRRTAPTSPAK